MELIPRNGTALATGVVAVKLTMPDEGVGVFKEGVFDGFTGNIAGLVVNGVFGGAAPETVGIEVDDPGTTIAGRVVGETGTGSAGTTIAGGFAGDFAGGAVG